MPRTLLALFLFLFLVTLISSSPAGLRVKRQMLAAYPGYGAPYYGGYGYPAAATAPMMAPSYGYNSALYGGYWG